MRTLAGSRHSLSRPIISGRPARAGCGLVGFAAFSAAAFDFAVFSRPVPFAAVGLVLTFVMVVVCMVSLSCWGLGLV